MGAINLDISNILNLLNKDQQRKRLNTTFTGLSKVMSDYDVSTRFNWVVTFLFSISYVHFTYKNKPAIKIALDWHSCMFISSNCVQCTAVWVVDYTSFQPPTVTLLPKAVEVEESDTGADTLYTFMPTDASDDSVTCSIQSVDPSTGTSRFQIDKTGKEKLKYVAEVCLNI